MGSSLRSSPDYVFHHLYVELPVVVQQTDDCNLDLCAESTRWRIGLSRAPDADGLPPLSASSTSSKATPTPLQQEADALLRLTSYVVAPVDAGNDLEHPCRSPPSGSSATAGDNDDAPHTDDVGVPEPRIYCLQFYLPQRYRTTDPLVLDISVLQDDVPVASCDVRFRLRSTATSSNSSAAAAEATASPRQLAAGPALAPVASPSAEATLPLSLLPEMAAGASIQLCVPGTSKLQVAADIGLTWSPQQGTLTSSAARSASGRHGGQHPLVHPMIPVIPPIALCPSSANDSRVGGVDTDALTTAQHHQRGGGGTSLYITLSDLLGSLSSSELLKSLGIHDNVSNPTSALSARDAPLLSSNTPAGAPASSTGPVLATLDNSLRSLEVRVALCRSSGELVTPPAHVASAALPDASSSAVFSGDASAKPSTAPPAATSGGTGSSPRQQRQRWKWAGASTVHIQLPQSSLEGNDVDTSGDGLGGLDTSHGSAGSSASRHRHHQHRQREDFADLHLLIYILTPGLAQSTEGQGHQQLPPAPIASAFGYLRLFDSSGRFITHPACSLHAVGAPVDASTGRDNAGCTLIVQEAGTGPGCHSASFPLVLYAGSPPFLPAAQTASSAAPDDEAAAAAGSQPMYQPSPVIRRVGADVDLSLLLGRTHQGASSHATTLSSTAASLVSTAHITPPGHLRLLDPVVVPPPLLTPLLPSDSRIPARTSGSGPGGSFAGVGAVVGGGGVEVLLADVGRAQQAGLFPSGLLLSVSVVSAPSASADDTDEDTVREDGFLAASDVDAAATCASDPLLRQLLVIALHSGDEASPSSIASVLSACVFSESRWMVRHSIEAAVCSWPAMAAAVLQYLRHVNAVIVASDGEDAAGNAAGQIDATLTGGSHESRWMVELVRAAGAHLFTTAPVDAASKQTANIADSEPATICAASLRVLSRLLSACFDPASHALPQAVERHVWGSLVAFAELDSDIDEHQHQQQQQQLEYQPGLLPPGPLQTLLSLSKAGVVSHLSILKATRVQALTAATSSAAIPVQLLHHTAGHAPLGTKLGNNGGIAAVSSFSDSCSSLSLHLLEWSAVVASAVTHAIRTGQLLGVTGLEHRSGSLPSSGSNNSATATTQLADDPLTHIMTSLRSLLLLTLDAVYTARSVAGSLALSHADHEILGSRLCGGIELVVGAACTVLGRVTASLASHPSAPDAAQQLVSSCGTWLTPLLSQLTASLVADTAANGTILATAATSAVPVQPHLLASASSATTTSAPRPATTTPSVVPATPRAPMPSPTAFAHKTAAPTPAMQPSSTAPSSTATTSEVINKYRRAGQSLGNGLGGATSATSSSSAPAFFAAATEVHLQTSNNAGAGQISDTSAIRPAVSAARTSLRAISLRGDGSGGAAARSTGVPPASAIVPGSSTPNLAASSQSAIGAASTPTPASDLSVQAPPATVHIHLQPSTGFLAEAAAIRCPLPQLLTPLKRHSNEHRLRLLKLIALVVMGRPLPASTASKPPVLLISDAAVALLVRHLTLEIESAVVSLISIATCPDTSAANHDAADALTIMVPLSAALHAVITALEGGSMRGSPATTSCHELLPVVWAAAAQLSAPLGMASRHPGAPALAARFLLPAVALSNALAAAQSGSTSSSSLQLAAARSLRHLLHAQNGAAMNIAAKIIALSDSSFDARPRWPLVLRTAGVPHPGRNRDAGANGEDEHDDESVKSAASALDGMDNASVNTARDESVSEDPADGFAALMLACSQWSERRLVDHSDADEEEDDIHSSDARNDVFVAPVGPLPLHVLQALSAPLLDSVLPLLSSSNAHTLSSANASNASASPAAAGTLLPAQSIQPLFKLITAAGTEAAPTTTSVSSASSPSSPAAALTELLSLLLLVTTPDGPGHNEAAAAALWPMVGSAISTAAAAVGSAASKLVAAGGSSIPSGSAIVRSSRPPPGPPASSSSSSASAGTSTAPATPAAGSVADSPTSTTSLLSSLRSITHLVILLLGRSFAIAAAIPDADEYDGMDAAAQVLAPPLGALKAALRTLLQAEDAVATGRASDYAAACASVLAAVNSDRATVASGKGSSVSNAGVVSGVMLHAGLSWLGLACASTFLGADGNDGKQSSDVAAPSLFDERCSLPIVAAAALLTPLLDGRINAFSAVIGTAVRSLWSLALCSGLMHARTQQLVLAVIDACGVEGSINRLQHLQPQDAARVLHSIAANDLCDLALSLHLSALCIACLPGCAAFAGHLRQHSPTASTTPSPIDFATPLSLGRCSDGNDDAASTIDALCLAHAAAQHALAMAALLEGNSAGEDNKGDGSRALQHALEFGATLRHQQERSLHWYDLGASATPQSKQFSDAASVLDGTVIKRLHGAFTLAFSSALSAQEYRLAASLAERLQAMLSNTCVTSLGCGVDDLATIITQARAAAAAAASAASTEIVTPQPINDLSATSAFAPSSGALLPHSTTTTTTAAPPEPSVAPVPPAAPAGASASSRSNRAGTVRASAPPPSSSHHSNSTSLSPAKHAQRTGGPGSPMRSPGKPAAPATTAATSSLGSPTEAQAGSAGGSTSGDDSHQLSSNLTAIANDAARLPLARLLHLVLSDCYIALEACSYFCNSAVPPPSVQAGWKTIADASASVLSSGSAATPAATPPAVAAGSKVPTFSLELLRFAPLINTTGLPPRLQPVYVIIGTVGCDGVSVSSAPSSSTVSGGGAAAPISWSVARLPIDTSIEAFAQQLQQCTPHASVFGPHVPVTVIEDSSLPAAGDAAEQTRQQQRLRFCGTGSLAAKCAAAAYRSGSIRKTAAATSSTSTLPAHVYVYPAFPVADNGASADASSEDSGSGGLCLRAFVVRGSTVTISGAAPPAPGGTPTTSSSTSGTLTTRSHSLRPSGPTIHTGSFKLKRDQPDHDILSAESSAIIAIDATIDVQALLPWVTRTHPLTPSSVSIGAVPLVSACKQWAFLAGGRIKSRLIWLHSVSLSASDAASALALTSTQSVLSPPLPLWDLSDAEGGAAGLSNQVAGHMLSGSKLGLDHKPVSVQAGVAAARSQQYAAALAQQRRMKLLAAAEHTSSGENVAGHLQQLQRQRLQLVLPASSALTGQPMKSAPSVSGTTTVHLSRPRPLSAAHQSALALVPSGGAVASGKAHGPANQLVTVPAPKPSLDLVVQVMSLVDNQQAQSNQALLQDPSNTVQINANYRPSVDSRSLLELSARCGGSMIMPSSSSPLPPGPRSITSGSLAVIPAWFALSVVQAGIHDLLCTRTWSYAAGPATARQCLSDYSEMKVIDREKQTTELRREWCRWEEKQKSAGIDTDDIPIPDWNNQIPRTLHPSAPALEKGLSLYLQLVAGAVCDSTDVGTLCGADSPQQLLLGLGAPAGHKSVAATSGAKPPTSTPAAASEAASAAGSIINDASAAVRLLTNEATW